MILDCAGSSADNSGARSQESQIYLQFPYSGKYSAKKRFASSMDRSQFSGVRTESEGICMLITGALFSCIISYSNSPMRNSIPLSCLAVHHSRSNARMPVIFSHSEINLVKHRMVAKKTESGMDFS